MSFKVKRISPKILILIILLLPLNIYVWNYLLKIEYFENITRHTNHLIQPALIAGFISFLFFFYTDF